MWASMLCWTRPLQRTRGRRSIPPFVKAYRKGISCEEMTLTHLAIIEDNHQHQHNILGHIDDDEEKFYDRITLEYQCVSLLRLGCPKHGFVEWIAESMTNNHVPIITIVGIIEAIFLCGLKQGARDSCPIASAVSVGG